MAMGSTPFSLIPHPPTPTAAHQQTGPQQPSHAQSTRLPVKAVRPPRPSSTSSIPQIGCATLPPTKSSVILRNKASPPSATTTPANASILDKLKHLRVDGDSNPSIASIPSIAVSRANNSCDASGKTGVESANNRCARASVVTASAKTGARLAPPNNNNNNNNSIVVNGNNNVIVSNNSQQKKSEESNSRNSGQLSNGRPGSIPVKRGIPPPRSRPTSSIFETPNQSMASNSQSSSSSSLAAKPTAAVKGTSKVVLSDESRGGAAKAGKCQPKGSAAQSQSSSAKPETSIAMVSPIMSREHRVSSPKPNDEKVKLKPKAESPALESVERGDGDGSDAQSQSAAAETDPKVADSSSHEEESANSSDVDSALLGIQPMAPLVRASQFAFLRQCSGARLGGHCSRFANNYSAIENGYTSDCTARHKYGPPPPPSAASGYLSESSAPLRRHPQPPPPTRADCANGHHRHLYHDNDSAANITAIRAANLFHLMHSKFNNNFYAQFCLDDSSSLSSDAGLVSGTEASTTTSSMSSSTGDPIAIAKSGPKYAPIRPSAAKAKPKKTDSAMQTETCLSSTAVWKKYLHEHHLMLKANHSVAPKPADSDPTRSLDRLGLKKSANGVVSKTTPVERHDSCESLKHGVQTKSGPNGARHDLLTAKRPLSSPGSSRVASTTIPGPARQWPKHAKGRPSLSDATHSDSEYNKAKHVSGVRAPQRDARLSADGQCGAAQSALSPWLQRHALAMQRNALTEAESMESLTSGGPTALLDGHYFLGRQQTQSRPNSASIRFRESASASPALACLSPKRSLARAGSSRAAKSSTDGSPAANGSFRDEDQMNASLLSLVSTSSVFSSAMEDKSCAHETRKLRRELDAANEKVVTLTSQLTTNAHMVAAFEQSLASMTARLQQLTATLELKDGELDRLRRTIESLQRADGGGGGQSGQQTKQSTSNNKISRASLIRRHTFANNCKTSHSADNNNGYGMSHFARQLSAESVSSASIGTDVSLSPAKSKKKPKSKSSAGQSSAGWLRSSFSKAFKKNKSGAKRGSLSDAEVADECESTGSVPNSPLMTSRAFAADSESETVTDLRRQLREKEMMLTDTRLESLTSAHQLESLRETVAQMRAEMMGLKQDNDRLQRLVSSRSLASSQSSMLSSPAVGNQSVGGGGQADSVESLEMEAVASALLADGGKAVTVLCGTHTVASLVVTPKTNWDQLDVMVKKCFREHLIRLDQSSGLGLSLDALACYQVGDERIARPIVTTRAKECAADRPEMLPYGYLVSESHVWLQFKSASDSLVFDTLTPKAIIHRFIGLLAEHRRIILCGPSGTGKSFLAHKLAEYLAIKRGVTTGLAHSPADGAIITFSVDHKSAKELRAYLSHVAEQCDAQYATSERVPTVIVLDNLHHIGSIVDVFSGLVCADANQYPYIIATMNQTNCSATNLQLQHNFRWVLFSNHIEPVKGFLFRYLRRKLIESEVKAAVNGQTAGVGGGELARVVDWIPKLWHHLNRFLETHSSCDVTIGPRLFLSCPIEVSGSQVWFTDLWNYSIVPYVIEATRDGIHMYGRRSQFVDPTDWVCETYPWTTAAAADWTRHLLRIRAEDVAVGAQYESGGRDCELKRTDSCSSSNSNDPLLSMFMRLQEAANYSSQTSAHTSPVTHQNTTQSAVNSG